MIVAIAIVPCGGGDDIGEDGGGRDGGLGGCSRST